MNIKKVVKEAEKAEKEISKLCSDLVQFNSAHPEGRTDECVSYIRDYLEKQNIENEVHTKETAKPNIVAKLPAESERTVLWVGHLDVVPEGKIELWTYPPYSGTIKDGYIYGRGSSDMKGACAAAMVSARILSQLDEPLPNNIEFWFTADEEIGGGAGARWLAESGRFKGDVCIIGDGDGGGPDVPSLDLGCKGIVRTKLVAKGKTAHSSIPFLGDNAINKLIEAVPWVEKIGDFRLDLPSEIEERIRSSIGFLKTTQSLNEVQADAVDRIFHYPTVTCNIISGGVKINVVPDYAEAEFDIRLTPGSKPMRVKARIEELVKESGIPGLEVEVNANETRAHGYYESPNSPFARQFAETVELIAGKKTLFKILTGGTDGIRTSKIAKIPSIGYGTSLTGQAHQPDEKVTVRNLVLGVQIYSAFPLKYKAYEI